MSKRAAIYARFSTDLQSERSIEDQVELCRSFAKSQGMTIASIFEDRAKSGASILGRDGLMAMMVAAKARAFDVLLVEHSDRIARSMRDLADIHEKLSFYGIAIRAVHSGATLDTALVGLFGLVGQMQREDGAKKVRRGMAGVIRDGRHAGGRAYGYRPVAGERGCLEIVEDEAEVVRRIFSEFASGRPPRLIAGALNAEGVPPPRGVRWNASTINGNAARGSGIIFNELYTGRIVWNKVAMLKNPETGRRVSRPNEQNVRASSEAPHLRIVDETLWTEAQALKAAKSRLHSSAKRRPKHLLSGLLRCGTCGSGMSVHDRDEAGRTRLRCSAIRENGSCTNNRRVHSHRIEAAVLAGLRERLREPSLIEAYVRAYNSERERLVGTSKRDRLKLQNRLHDAQRALDRALQNLVHGRITESEADEVLPVLRTARDEANASLQACRDDAAPIALHPATLKRYLETVESLANTLREHAEAEDRGSVIADFRELVESVTVHAEPGSKEINITVQGRLSALIGGDVFPSNVGGRVVAEEGHAIPHIG